MNGLPLAGSALVLFEKHCESLLDRRSRFSLGINRRKSGCYLRNLCPAVDPPDKALTADTAEVARTGQRLAEGLLPKAA
jgi:hypothetical protein